MHQAQGDEAKEETEEGEVDEDDEIVPEGNGRIGAQVDEVGDEVGGVGEEEQPEEGGGEGKKRAFLPVEGDGGEEEWEPGEEEQCNTKSPLSIPKDIKDRVSNKSQTNNPLLDKYAWQPGGGCQVMYPPVMCETSIWAPTLSLAMLALMFSY